MRFEKEKRGVKSRLPSSGGGWWGRRAYASGPSFLPLGGAGSGFDRGTQGALGVQFDGASGELDDECLVVAFPVDRALIPCLLDDLVRVGGQDLDDDIRAPVLP